MKRLEEYYKKMINQYPHLKGDIDDYYQLALDEIESGESPDNEFSLFQNEVQNLIEENNDCL